MLDKRARAQKRKEVLSTLSDDSGCVTETGATSNKEVEQQTEKKIDVPFVPVYLHDDDDTPVPHLKEQRSVRTLKVHFEFLANTPFDPLKRPNWWIGDENENSSDSGSIKSEPDDVIRSVRPIFKRPFSTPDSRRIDKIGDEHFTDSIGHFNIPSPR